MENIVLRQSLRARTGAHISVERKKVIKENIVVGFALVYTVAVTMFGHRERKQMSVYVDDMMADFGQMKMCHLVADTTEELLSMVDKIDVKRKWIQNKGTYLEHFDVCISKRILAVKAGAVEIRYGKQLAVFLERKKKRFMKK